ncbi:MAG TPA: TonB family protein [Xanthomonadaceae bacterium]|nr:TonB family protein [Xanthomonadaceae bacterium]
MVHAARFPTQVPGFVEVPSLDFNRIFGYATAILVHGVLLMLLLVPITAPPALAPPRVEQPYVPIERKLEPPPPLPPIRVPVVQHPTHPAPTRPVQQPMQPLDPQPVVDRAAVTDPVPAQPPVDTGNTIQPPVGPVAGVQLEYAQAPAPAYPRDALRDGVEGSVLLKVLVDIDGRPLEVQVARSSGNRSLDRAAREQVLQRWRFRPAMQGGRAVRAIGLVPVDFRLQ